MPIKLQSVLYFWPNIQIVIISHTKNQNDTGNVIVSNLVEPSYSPVQVFLGHV